MASRLQTSPQESVDTSETSSDAPAAESEISETSSGSGRDDAVSYYSPNSEEEEDDEDEDEVAQERKRPIKVSVKFQDFQSIFETEQVAVLEQGAKPGTATGVFSNPTDDKFQWFSAILKANPNDSGGYLYSCTVVGGFISSGAFLSGVLKERLHRDFEDNFLKNLIYSDVKGVDNFGRGLLTARARRIRSFTAFSALRVALASIGVRLKTKCAQVDPSGDVNLSMASMVIHDGTDTASSESGAGAPPPAVLKELTFSTSKAPPPPPKKKRVPELKSHYQDGASDEQAYFKIGEIIDERVSPVPIRPCMLCGRKARTTWRGIHKSHLIPHAGLTDKENQMLQYLLHCQPRLLDASDRTFLGAISPSMRNCCSNILPTCAACNEDLDAGGLHLHAEDTGGKITVKVCEWEIEEQEERVSAKQVPTSLKCFEEGLSLLACSGVTRMFWRVHAAVGLAKHMVHRHFLVPPEEFKGGVGPLSDWEAGGGSSGPAKGGSKGSERCGKDRKAASGRRRTTSANERDSPGDAHRSLNSIRGTGGLGAALHCKSLAPKRKGTSSRARHYPDQAQRKPVSVFMSMDMKIDEEQAEAWASGMADRDTDDLPPYVIATAQ